MWPFFTPPPLSRTANHIGVQELVSLVQDYSIQQVVITHINHDNLLRAELVKKTASHGITVAYDGLTLEV